MINFWISVLVFSASFIRGILEIFLLTKIRQIYEVLPFLSFWCIWYFVVFYTASFIISFFTKRSLEDIMRFISKFFFIIILPPIIDRFVFGRTQAYYYERPEDIIKHFFSFFLGTERVGKALVLNVLFIHFFVFLYTFSVVLRSEVLNHSFGRAFLKAFIRALLCFISLYTASSFYAVGGFLPLIFPVVPLLTSTAIPFYNSVHGFFFSVLLFLMIFFSTKDKLKKPKLKEFFERFGFRPSYLIPFLCGYIFSGFDIWKLPVIFYVGISIPFFEIFKVKEEKEKWKVFFPVLCIALFSHYILISFLIFILLYYAKEFFKELERLGVGERLWDLRFVILFFVGFACGKLYIFFIVDWIFVVFFLSLALLLNNVYLSFVGFIPFLISGEPEFIFSAFLGYTICVLSGSLWKYTIFISSSLIYFILKNFWFG